MAEMPELLSLGGYMAPMSQRGTASCSLVQFPSQFTPGPEKGIPVVQMGISGSDVHPPLESCWF